MEVVAEGLGFPEGPVVMPDGSILFVELFASLISRADRGRKHVVAEIGGGPNGAAIGPNGALWICNNGGVDPGRGRFRDGPDAVGRIERLDLSTGRWERVVDTIAGRHLSAPNDLVFDAEGGLWFTDFGKLLDGSRHYSGLYYMTPGGGETREVIHGAVSFNGVDLSPDGGHVFVADTETARILRFEIVAPGRLRLAPDGRPERLVVNVPGDIMLDSLAVTAGGRVCVGTLLKGCITTVDVDDGSSSCTMFPDTLVTNIAFGGSGMRDAFVTLSATGRIVKVRWPEPGLKLNFP